jgi:hypothetical protein
MTENSTIINGNIESSYKTVFEQTYYELARQKQSFLGATPAVIHKPFTGKVYGISRAGDLELKKDNSRNPLRKYDDYLFDRRWAKKDAWFKNIVMDRHDVYDAIADPTSVIYSALIDAKNVLEDRVIINAASADVQIGKDQGSTEIITAEEDGVETIDATSAYNYDVIKQVSTNFKNKYINGYKVIAQTATEESELLDDEKLINRDYRSNTNTSVDTGTIMPSLGIHFISNFAGSDNGQGGVGKIPNTIIPEVGGLRYCVALAEGAVQIALTEIDIDFLDKNPLYQHSSTISLTLRVYGLRLEGKKVILIKKTI